MDINPNRLGGALPPSWAGFLFNPRDRGIATLRERTGATNPHFALRERIELKNPNTMGNILSLTS